MKAVRIHQYGGVSSLQFEDAPMPICASNEIIIKVIGSSVNPVDWKIRQGQLQAMIKYEMPFIPGWDVAGIVHYTGALAARFKVGDAVYSRPDIARNGSYAEFIVVRESEVALKPKTISFIEAAVLPLAGITAFEALITVGEIAPGQRVLIHAAAGGVGSLAVQIAKAKGAYVIATGSRKNQDLIESLGADEFFDYKTQSLKDSVKNINLVFDTMGGKTQQESWQVMTPNGMLVSIAEDPEEDVKQWPNLRGAFLFIKPNATVLKQLAQMVDEGLVRPVIGSEFSLKDIQQAHTLSETGHALGKIALYVGQP